MDERGGLTHFKGIGGMAAALTLGLRGHNVTVLESAAKVPFNHGSANMKIDPR